MQISLTWYEIALAAEVGMRRQLEVLKRGLKSHHRAAHEDPWSIHIQAAAGELAAAKALGRYWSGSVNTFRTGGDVGALQVRTRSKAHYDLIVRDDDKESDCFILVVGEIPDFDVKGWIGGKEAKQAQWRQSYGGREAAYFVPHAALHALDLLNGTHAPHTRRARMASFCEECGHSVYEQGPDGLWRCGLCHATH